MIIEKSETKLVAEGILQSSPEAGFSFGSESLLQFLRNNLPKEYTSVFMEYWGKVRVTIERLEE